MDQYKEELPFGMKIALNRCRQYSIMHANYMEREIRKQLPNLNVYEKERIERDLRRDCSIENLKLNYL